MMPTNAQDDAEAMEQALAVLASGGSFGSAAAAAGRDVRTLYNWRRESDYFRAALLNHQAERLDQHLQEAQAVRGVTRKVLLASGQAVQDPEFVKGVGADPKDFALGLSALASTINKAQEMERRALGIPDDPTTAVQVNLQTNVAVATRAQGDEFVPPSEKIDDFISRDLGIPLAWIRPRALWILRQATRPEVHQVVMIVGKGGSKTTIASILLAYRLAHLLALPDPAAHYGLMPGSLVGVINMSASGKNQAQLAIFGELRRHLKNAPWFQKHARPESMGDDGLPGTSQQVRWAGKNVIAFCGNSQSEGAEGISFQTAAVDEVCRLPEEGHQRVLTADALINPVRETMATRFGRASLAVMMSWPEHKSDFLHREKDVALKAGIAEDLSATFLASPLVPAGGQAEADRRDALKQPPFSDVPTEAFRSTTGTLVIHAPVWQVNPEADLAIIRQTWEQRPRDFACMEAARPLAEVEASFFRDPEIVRERATPNRHHPIRPDGTFEEWFRGSPSHLYYAHIDVGVSKDAAGICVGHPEGGKVVHDLTLEVVPPEGGEITLESLRQVLYTMQGRGFTFALATCDGFEGVSMRQEIESHGIACENYSVDKSREAYDTWREELQTGGLDYYPYEPLFQNARSLVDLGKKVDHSRTGAKDVSDAAAAVTVHCKKAGGSRIGSFA